MAGEELLSLLGPNDLAQFQNTVISANPYNIAGRSLAGWQPDTSTWSPATSGLTSFGKSFLSGIMQNWAREDAAKQLNSVVSVLPSLRSDPYNVTAPEGVDPDAFGLLKGSAILSKQRQDYEQSQFDRKFNSELLAKMLGKKAEIVGEKAAYDAIGEGGANPNSPQYKTTKDKEDQLVNFRKEFNALDPVKNFTKISQAAQAMAGALKDYGKVSDQELVRYGILMIEPGLAVREGEAAAIGKSQSFPDAWRGELMGALEGKSSLGPTAREGLKNLALRAYNSHKNLYDKTLDVYSKEGERLGFKPEQFSIIGTAPDAENIFATRNSVAPDASSPADLLAAIKAEKQRRSMTGGASGGF